MKLKLDDNGAAVITDGKPVYVHDDGKEIAFDAAGTVATIGRLNGEAKAHREAKEALEARLKAFEGLDDPEAARKALSTIKSIDEKKLVDAGNLDKIKADERAAAIKDFVEREHKPLLDRYAQRDREYQSEKFGNAFAGSKYIADKMRIPADMVQARFGHLLKIENGRIVGTDTNGNQVFSRAKPGEAANFDEWLEAVVEQYPYKDDILKGTDASGSGARNGGAGGGGGGKTITRSKFDSLNHEQRQQFFKDGGRIA